MNFEFYQSPLEITELGIVYCETEDGEKGLVFDEQKKGLRRHPQLLLLSVRDRNPIL